MAEVESFRDPREDIKAAIRAYAMEDGVYRIGTRAMTKDEWQDSAISGEARKTLSASLSDITQEKRDAYARLDQSKFAGSGYAEYGKRVVDREYESDLTRAIDALSDSYSAYYGDLPRNQATGKLTRINTLSYMVSSAMTVDEGTLYALSAGLSFEEAIALARDAVRLQDAIADRLVTYNPQDP